VVAAGLFGTFKIPVEKFPALGGRSVVIGLHLLALSVVAPARISADIQTTTQELAVNVFPYGKVSVPSSLTLRSADTHFGAVSGTLAVSYWARTSAGGTLTIQGESEFSPAGGPAVAQVSFICTGATLGTGCSGTHNLSTTAQATLVDLPSESCTGGGGACSAQDPNGILVQFLVPSKPSFKTGSYSAQVVLTVSTL
jgi:hypothetical protein